MARSADGHFLVRIEDIDLGRAREDYVRQILDDLAWLGIDWDGPVLRQSSRFDAYRQAAGMLEARGLIYPCFATRKEIDAAASEGLAPARDPDGAFVYPGLWRHAAPSEVARRREAGEPFALRLDMARALAVTGDTPLTYAALGDNGEMRTVTANPARWGDVVIVRKDVPASYHLAVVVDDAAQAVTHVTRGRDLEAQTDIHRLLQALLGVTPPTYYHHNLITDATGRKLSKSDGASSLRRLRDAGASRCDVLALIGTFDVPPVSRFAC